MVASSQVGERRERFSSVPALGVYVPDRGFGKARRVKLISWGVLLFWAFIYGACFALFPPSFIAPMFVPLIPLLACVMWILPATGRRPSKLLDHLFLGVTAALIAWPIYLAVVIPGLPWITMTRVFIIPFALLFVLQISTVESVLRDLKEVLAANRLAVRLLVVFVVIQMISIVFSDNTFDSLQRFIISQIYWTLMFFAGCYLFRDRAYLYRWLSLLILLAVYTSILGMWEWRIGRLPWAGHIPSFLQINDPSVLRSLAGSTRAGSIGHRVQSTFTVSLGFGEFLALVTPFIIHFAVEDRRRIIRWANWLLLPFLFFTIVSSGARIGSVGFVLSVLLYTAAWAVREWRIKKDSLIGPALTLGFPLVAVSLIGLTIFSGRLRQIVWGGGNTQMSNDARVEQFQMGWPKVLHWPFGYGIGQGANVLGFTSEDGMLTIDSYTLRLCLEYGILGTLVFYAFFLSGILPGAKIGLKATDQYSKLSIPLAISLLVFLNGKTVYGLESNHPIPFMMMGAICAIVAANSSRRPSADSRGAHLAPIAAA